MIRAAIVGLGRGGQMPAASVRGKSERLHFSHAVRRDPAPAGTFAAEHGLRVVGRLDADAVAGVAPYPISPAEMVDVVAAFAAIVAASGSDGRVCDV